MTLIPRRIKVGLELTSKCNLRCGMCPLPVLRRPYEDMEWWVVEKAEREIHGAGLKLKWLHEMGEPLLYARIDDAIRLFPEASVSTNGLVLTEAVGAKLLASPLKRLRICVDSINPKVYPQLPQLIESARKAGAIGACLSGAGSTVLAFSDSVRTITRIEAAFGAAAADTDLTGRIAVVSFRNGGAQVIKRG